MLATITSSERTSTEHDDDHDRFDWLAHHMLTVYDPGSGMAKFHDADAGGDDADDEG